MPQSFIKSDFVSDYNDGKDCPITKAIKRIFKPFAVSASSEFIWIKQTESEPPKKFFYKSIRLNNKTIANRKFGDAEISEIKDAFEKDPNTIATFSISQVQTQLRIFQKEIV